MAINGKWVYEDLTWAEMNQAVEAGLIPVLPVGTMEQHGPHLPVKMDRWTATEVARAACEQPAARLLFMPPVAYGYTTHVMDFPGGPLRDIHPLHRRYLEVAGLSRLQSDHRYQRARL